ncbi:MAG TPA: hypothetical protein VG964_00750 [Candidatus Saccharimonadales bacterium]|nr:hypothetical protein [Candidatus Saccharimonadales bacterium]
MSFDNEVIPLSDKAHKRAILAFWNVLGVLLPVIGIILLILDARDPYATAGQVETDIVAGSLLLTVLCLNVVWFIVHIVQMIDEIRNPTPIERRDNELDEAWDQLEADSLEFDESDEIIRYIDDELYLCLGDDFATAVDLKLLKNDEGHWQLFVPQHEDVPVPVSHVASLRTRVRELDKAIIDEIKRLASETA